MTAYHRALLVHDGAVTDLVEASVLKPIAVDVLDQKPVRIDGEAGAWLELPAETALVRRRIAIRGRGT